LGIPAAEEVPDMLKDLLKELANTSPILGAAILSIEGLPLVSYFHTGNDAVIISAMVAGIHSAGEQTVRELRQGDLKSIIVEGEFGKTLIIAIPDGYLLTITAPENAKLGLIFSDAKRAAREAGRLLRSL
jgi:predicted regulator of Ras-like GTPase activity (Roadblock/LC7/MglB family)